MSPIIGTTIDFVCPEGLKLSHDNDGFNSFDDKFTILCTTRKTYDIPKEVTDWPSCVKSCPKRLPYIPSLDETGLVRIDAQNTIPAGQSGKYICSDTNLGINRVKMIFYNFFFIYIIKAGFQNFSRSLEQFFLTVGQNNFGNKILFLARVSKSFISTFLSSSFFFLLRTLIKYWQFVVYSIH